MRRSDDLRVTNRLAREAGEHYSRERGRGRTHEQALFDVVVMAVAVGEEPDPALVERALAAHAVMSGGDHEVEHGESDDVLAWFAPPEVLAARAAAEQRARGWMWA